MIAVEEEVSVRLRADIVAAADYRTLAPDARDLCLFVLDTVSDPNFPGALIPVVTSAETIEVYATAHSRSTWRRLKPVLLAFAGPTLTSFNGLPSDLPAGEPVADIVATVQPAITAAIRLPDQPNRLLSALRGFARARDTLLRAPALQRRAPEPTSWLLARFQDYLNVGARDPATDVLLRLREELRLDALNLKFMEVQLLATFDDWTAVVNLPGFAQLCVARRPPAITALLLEALYRAHLESAFDATDADQISARYIESVRPLAQPMLTLPAPPTLTAGGLRIFALEALGSPGRSDLIEVVESHIEEIGWIADDLPRRQKETATDLLGETTVLDAARGALVEVDKLESLSALAGAIASLDKLSPDELAQLREAEPFRSLFRSVSELVPSHRMPSNWLEWLDEASQPTFTDALDVARRAMDEWQIDEVVKDPVAVAKFVAALEAAQNDDVAAERTSQALPFIVGWLRRDTEFPRPAASPIYSSLLTLFAMNIGRGRGVYESTQVIINALLATGLTEKSYRDMLADIEELAGAGFGVDMTYWVLEIIEDLLRFSAPDATARQTFLHGALSRVSPIYGRLSSLQRAAIARLAEELGWELPTVGITNEGRLGDSLAAKLSGYRIAIYSLTESSSRQAKAALAATESTVLVDTNADHVGTARLRALSENADLFVLTSLSAKHAATDFIREHRGAKPLVYAQGRGFSSILRAIEEFLQPTRF